MKTYLSLILIVSACHTYCQGFIINDNNPVIIDFSNFEGNGFSPNPVAGQLDSDVWKFEGFSEGSTSFGGTYVTGDFARGERSGGVGTGGIYAFDIDNLGDICLGVQPIGTDFTPGNITLKIENQTGNVITSILISYDIYEFNDQNRSSSISCSHSPDDITYQEEGDLDHITQEAMSTDPSWLATAKSIEITDLFILTGESYYFQWTGDDVGGSGSRDEIGLDNISITVKTISLPEINSFTPDEGTIGSLVTIHGKGFLEEPTVDQVLFNGTDANFEIISDTEINALLPSPTTSGKITVLADEYEAESSIDFIVFTDELGGCTIGTRDLIFSEYIEGSADNKAIEIYNGTGSSLDLSNYSIETYFNGNESPSITLSLTGILANQGTYIIGKSGADIEISTIADVFSNVANFNGNDVIVLRNDITGDIIDAIGQLGNTDFFAQNVTMIRKSTVYQGDAIATDAFSTSEWDAFTIDTFSDLQSHSITIGPPPIIEEQPESICVDASTGITTIILSLASSDATQYQWKKWNGSTWVNVDATTDGIDVHSGFLSASLSIDVAETPEIGARYGDQYYCEVGFNNNCFQNSEVAYLEDGTIDPCVTISLPVELTYFSGEVFNSTAKLTWQTSSEINNEGFFLEKSLNGKYFEAIGFIPGINSNIPAHYSYLDQSFFQSSYYRLKQIDFDGKFSYSNTIFLHPQSAVEALIYPNPIGNEPIILFPDSKFLLLITDLSGSVIHNQTINHTDAVKTLSELSNGVYFIKLQSKNLIHHQRIIVNTQ